MRTKTLRHRWSGGSALVARRRAPAAAFLLGLLMAAGCASVSPSLAELDPIELEHQLEEDRAAVRRYREGLRAILAHVESRPDLFDARQRAGQPLLGREEREAVCCLGSYWGERTLPQVPSKEVRSTR